MTRHKKPSTLQEQYDILLKRCNELRDYIHELLDDQQTDREELEYLYAFIAHKELDEEYYFFRKHAHEEYSTDSPFPTLKL